MEQPARKRKEKPKHDESLAPIEFAAPYSLADCLYRLRDTKYLGSGLIGPGIEPSFEKVDAITYKFQVRRTWYDYRHRSYSSYVEIRGYLRALDSGTTIVVARLRVSPLAYMLVALIATMALIVIIFFPNPRAVSLMFSLPFLAMAAGYGGLIYLDRRVLLYLIRNTLGGDV